MEEIVREKEKEEYHREREQREEERERESGAAIRVRLWPSSLLLLPTLQASQHCRVEVATSVLFSLPFSGYRLLCLAVPSQARYERHFLLSLRVLPGCNLRLLEPVFGLFVCCMPSFTIYVTW